MNIFCTAVSQHGPGNVNEKLFIPHSNINASFHKNKSGRQSFRSEQKYGKAAKNLYFCGT